MNENIDPAAHRLVLVRVENGWTIHASGPPGDIGVVHVARKPAELAALLQDWAEHQTLER